MAPPLILASTSVYRRQLLERLRLPFTTVAPPIDEESLKRPDLSPWELAEFLAQAKCQSVSDLHPTSVVIGSDQLVELEGQVLGKPGTAERAREQLSQLAARKHRLITAVVIRQGNIERAHTDITTMEMRPLSTTEIERYVVADQPLNCAGSYKLEQLGITLFHGIESRDHTAIIGLPLLAVADLLRQFHYDLP